MSRSGRPPPLRVLALLLVLLGSAARSGAEEPMDEEQVADSPYPAAFRERVNAAIDRGVRWLKQAQRADGTWKGVHDRGYPMTQRTVATIVRTTGRTPEEAADAIVALALDPRRTGEHVVLE